MIVDIEVPHEDLLRIAKLVEVWADASKTLPADHQTVRIMFLACLQIIKTCGPGYCRIAAVSCQKWGADDLR